MIRTLGCNPEWIITYKVSDCLENLSFFIAGFYFDRL